ncbi:MAG TPA: hypothetical protein DEA08_03460 [Planctomycetes bacterium]|nr:hypothetical protein [Planctomycetota bacterium]
MAAVQLPAPSPLVARIVALASDPQVAAGELGQALNADPILSAQVIGIANSGLYSPRSPIASVEHAVRFLGVRAVRNVVLCVAVRRLVPTEEMPDFPFDAYWEGSLRRATASQVLGKALGVRGVDELFTIGLCQDVGVLVGCQQHPERVPLWRDLLARHTSQREEQEAKLGVSHAELGARMLEEWGLPQELVDPIRHHHAPSGAPPAVRRRAEVARASEQLSDLFDLKGGPALQQAQEALRELGLDPETLPALTDEIRVALAEAAASLNLEVGQQPSYQEIAASACQGMYELNHSYEELTQRLEQALREKEELLAELERLNAELEIRALRDGLTGLLNRRAFDEAFERELYRSARESEPISIVLLDIDHFKTFNDTYGHLIGDEVLRHVAGKISGVLRTSDTVARFGGEEFVLILPSTNEEGARRVAERVRVVIAVSPLECDAGSLSVTASLGGLTTRAPRTKPLAPAPLLERADAALYRAKEGGRNRVEWSS